MPKRIISRRDFLRLAGLGASAIALRPLAPASQGPFPDAERLGRVTVGKIDVFTRPDASSQVVGALYEDQVVPWMHEVVGPMAGRINQRWVETPYGFVWGGQLQPVRNQPNTPASSLPPTSLGSGMWAEVTVPYVDLILDNPPARAPWLQYRASIGLPPRFFYSQIVWVDQVRVEPSGGIQYRLNEKYGSGDIFWAPAEALRPLTAEEMAPINPDAEDKHIRVNLWFQTLACYEGNTEVHFARISSGAMYDLGGNKVNAWSTPLGGKDNGVNIDRDHKISFQQNQGPWLLRIRKRPLWAS